MKLLCAAALISAAAMYGQANTALLTTRIGPLTNGRPRIDTILHNQSSVPLTAYIVLEKVTGREFPRTPITDSVTDGELKEIPAGGEGVVQPSFAEDPANVKYRIVTALFGNGSVFGDEAWARLFILRRRYAVQALEVVIAELEAGKHMTGTDLLQQLEASRLRLVSVQKATAQASTVAASRLLPASRTRDRFEETTPELKAANIQAEADEGLVHFTDRYHREAAAVLALSPPGLWTNLPQEERVQHMIDKFTADRKRVIESKPALLDARP